MGRRGRIHRAILAVTGMLILGACQSRLPAIARPSPAPSELAAALIAAPPAPDAVTGPIIVGYKEIGARTLQAHIFLPPGWTPETRSAAFVFFHGGDWTNGTPTWGYDLCQAMSEEGMVAISFEYRLSDHRTITPVNAMEDAKSAVRWTRQNADHLGVDANHIAAAGVSAGGHLAATTAMLEAFEPPTEDQATSAVPNALLLWSAPVDVTVNPWFRRLLLRRAKAEDCSPARYVRADLPPTILFKATADATAVYPTVESLCDAMEAAGNRCELHLYRGQPHLFETQPRQEDVIARMTTFLASLDYVTTQPED